MCGSVPAGEFGHINSHPPVMSEVVELDLAEESSRDRRGGESPRVRIATEFEASDEQPDADAGLGAGDQRELLEDVWGTGSRHRDPDQAALGLGRHQLTERAGDGALGCSRFPFGAGREPRDGLFAERDVGGAGSDVS